MINTKIWMFTLGSFLAISFTICALGAWLMPNLPIRHQTLEAVLPGFVWISPGMFLLGLVESAFFGLAAGFLFATLHNFFSVRLEPQH